MTSCAIWWRGTYANLAGISPAFQKLRAQVLMLVLVSPTCYGLALLYSPASHHDAALSMGTYSVLVPKRFDAITCCNGMQARRAS